MRLKLGRPDIARHADRFTVPAATADTPLSVTWLGVATLLLDDGTSALMTDGFFSRPGFAAVAAGKVAPSAARVTAAWPGPASGRWRP
jgi:L-ascorbate metabolism protein UlaG (beta-lactamase superfamily)